MRRIFLVSLVLGFLSYGAAHGQESLFTPGQISALRSRAIDFSSRKENTRLVVEVAVRLKEFADLVPELQARNMINPELSATTIRLRRFSVAWVYAQQVATSLLVPIYENNRTVDMLSMRILSVFPDDFGQLKKELLSSFDFTRALFNQVDWDNFEAVSISKIAPRYRVTLFFEQQFARERPDR